MGDHLAALTSIFTEVYYWSMVAIMFLVPLGLCLREVAASRRKNMMHSLMRNTMILPVVMVPFYVYGWAIYNGWPNGPGFTGGPIGDLSRARSWDSGMGAILGGPDSHHAARLTGVGRGVFFMYAWITVCIVSGALIERIRHGAFWILAAMTGSLVWATGAAWGWHPDGWMVQLLGYHDAYASGVVHALAGGLALGVLVVLGPRMGKVAADGTPRTIVPHDPWLVTVGMFMIYTGMWGFHMAGNTPMADLGAYAGMDTSFWSTTTVYLSPTTTSAVTVNFLLALSGGLLAGYLVSGGDAFWTCSSGLSGLVAASAGNDLYHPVQALFVAMVTVPIVYKVHHYVERGFRIDDGVGVIAVHGYAGVTGLLISGVVLWGYPASLFYPASITPWGQVGGAVVVFVILGFIPGYVMSRLLDAIGILRVPERLEVAGLDCAVARARRAHERAMVASEQEKAQETETPGDP